VSANVFMCRRLSVLYCVYVHEAQCPLMVYVQEAQCPLMCLGAGGSVSANVFMCRRLSVR
jgi:hypothetical protein